jgi:NAD(P)-dependent dehydrogenase (short-subunit alcohol dehydrogenase family)
MSKMAIITGASQGLGLAFAEHLSQSGYTTVLIARTPSTVEKAAASIREKGGNAVSYAVDITDEREMTRLAEDIQKRYGTISILINNAGILHTETLENMPAEEIRYDLDVSLFGPVLTTKLFSPMIETGGKILFISSGFGLMGPAGYSVYSAAKGGMINFAESVKRELHKRKIGVYVAVPSDIDTPGFQMELAGLPEWMKVSQARGKPQPADKVAGRIMSRCSGNRFLIFSDPGVRMLHVVNHLVPGRIRDLILNAMFPRP